MTDEATVDTPYERVQLAQLDCESTPHVCFQMTKGKITRNGATPWYTTLGLGTPPQELRFMLDTGTINTWITARCCATPACQQHRCFDPDVSASFRPGDEPPTSVSFGPWGSMGVVLGHDSCQLPYVTVEGIRSITLNDSLSLYLSVCYEGAQFAALACDGGLAIPAVPCAKPTALLEQLQHQGFITDPLAAFYFDPLRGEGQCLMGAIDQHRFELSSCNTLPVIPLSGELSYLWNVNLDLLEIAGTPVSTNGSLTLDTGSSCFKGGKTIIARMLDVLTDQGRRPTRISDPSDLSEYPDIQLTLGGQSYTLTPAEYFLSIGPNDWELGVHYLEGLPDELLIVGSVFLDTLYSIFQYETQTPGLRAVTLANPIRKKMSVSGTWENEFGSTLELGPVASDGTFRGSYLSHTGATGRYPVVGVADPQPVGNNQAVSFCVSWRSLEGPEDPSWHWVSGFTGLLNLRSGEETLATTYLLQQNTSATMPEWMATAIYPATFRRKLTTM
jgi:hypothetical protein